MITGKDLKRMAAAIPDDAYVTINGNYNVSVEEVTVESADPFGFSHADLKLTSGFSITKDSVLKEMFRFQHIGSSTPDAETR